MYTAHDHVVEVGGTEVVHAITFTCVLIQCCASSRAGLAVRGMMSIHVNEVLLLHADKNTVV